MSSIKPSKQRKMRSEAPAHIRGRYLHMHLSDELRKKHGRRSVRVRKEDRVKVIKGQFKGKSGKIEDIDTKRTKLFIQGIEVQKKDGTKVRFPIAPANGIITELYLEDKRRQKALKAK